MMLGPRREVRIEMISNSLRGLAAALVIGTASVAAAGMATVGLAHAAGVRAAVGKPLQDAISLAKEHKGSAAMAKVHEAESVGGLTADERRLIDQTKQYVMVSTGDFSGGVTSATMAKAKFAADYNNHRYHDVVSTDVDLLKKFGAYDGQSQLLVAQAYYENGEYKTALNLLDGLGNGDQVISLKMAAAAKSGDSEMVAQSAESLVLKGQSKYWPYLFTAADNIHPNDEGTLGVYRVRLLTGNMRNADDYSTATQIALVLGYPQEAAAIEQKGFDSKVLSDQRQQRLLDQAKQAAAQQAAQMPAIVKKAQAGKTGDDLIKLAEIDWGIGRYQDGVDAAQAGIKKGAKDPDIAQIALGMNYTGLKKSSQAAHAFAEVKDPKAKAVARLWSVYARTH
jgi:hypothetical protein